MNDCPSRTFKGSRVMPDGKRFEMIRCEHGTTVCGWPISMEDSVCDACYKSGKLLIEEMINRALISKIKYGDRKDIAHKKDLAEISTKVKNRLGATKCEDTLVEAVTEGNLSVERAVDIASGSGLDLQKELIDDNVQQESKDIESVETTTTTIIVLEEDPDFNKELEYDIESIGKTDGSVEEVSDEKTGGEDVG